MPTTSTPSSAFLRARSPTSLTLAPRAARAPCNGISYAIKTEYDQQVWEECSRLITNCIIYYNVTILSHLFAHKERRGDAAGAALLTQVSPVVWQHINLCGRDQFTKAPEVINMAAIIQASNRTRPARPRALIAEVYLFLGGFTKIPIFLNNGIDHWRQKLRTKEPGSLRSTCRDVRRVSARSGPKLSPTRPLGEPSSCRAPPGRAQGIPGPRGHKYHLGSLPAVAWI